MKETAKRLLSMALVLVMVLSQLPATAMAAGNTESEGSSTTPSVADAFGFKTVPPADFDATDGIHPFSHSGTKDTINLIPVKEISLLTTKKSEEDFSEWISTGNLYNFDTDTILDGGLFSSNPASSGWYIPGANFSTADPVQTFDTGDEKFRVASGVAYDPTGSGRDDHVFYYGMIECDLSADPSKNNYLVMQDYSYEGGQNVTSVTSHLNPAEGTTNAYHWTTNRSLDVNAPDKYLSVIAGNFNGNGEETVVLYDPQFGNLTLRECTVGDGGIRTDLVYDLGNKVTVGDVILNTFWSNTTASGKDNQYDLYNFLPLIHMAAGDLDGDDKDELVVAVTPLKNYGDKTQPNKFEECYSRVLVFNKENDGSGNAVWTLKASQSLLADYYNSMCGAAAVIGDLDMDNQNELLIAGQKLGYTKSSIYIDSQYTVMEYAYSSETGSWELTYGPFHDLDFTTGISPTANSADSVQPVYTVPSVGLVHLDGIQKAPSLFVSGYVFDCAIRNGGLSLELRTDDLAEDVQINKSTVNGEGLMMTNQSMRQPVIGNFDGSIDGKEQLLVPICGTMRYQNGQEEVR